MALVNESRRGILAADRAQAREQVVEMLTKAYWMEIETVMSYLAAAINLDGVRAREIAESLHQDVAEELGHARRFGERIKELYGVVPGRWSSPPSRPTSSRRSTRPTWWRSSGA
ncbi:MAG: ferritin-like domain-containing protein [Solirubrobacteraceae bacterium]